MSNRPTQPTTEQDEPATRLDRQTTRPHSPARTGEQPQSDAAEPAGAANEDEVTLGSELSFPASDPPAWMGGTATS